MVSHSKRGPSLTVEPPSQVRFPGPSLRPARTTIKLINNTKTRMAFKIKTTAPSFYGVRPNSGVVLPNSTTEIEIARQPFTQVEGKKINHKFMVQSMVVPDDVVELNKLWENVDPTKLGITKLRCVFEDSTSLAVNQATTQPQSLPTQPTPERQESPHKIPTTKGDAKKLNDQSTSAGSSSKRFSNETSVNALNGGNHIKEEPRPEGSSIDRPPPTTSMESMRRILHGGSRNATEVTNQKPLLQKEQSFGEQQQQSPEEKIGLSSKQVSYAGLANVQRISERSELVQQPSPKASLSLQLPKYLMSHHSNNSTSIASKNPFSPKPSPTKLTSPKISENKMLMNKKSAQTSTSDHKETKKRKSADIFTQLQIATMNSEIHQLRTENKYLFNENSVLKEEIQYRHQLQPSAVRGEYTIPHSYLPQTQQQVPLCYVIASVTFALLCLIIGKFVL